ncbi:MAG: replication initiation factor domain-containing protein [Acholeplasma sp.]|nr:replication initiation factor domain-containing protein [Acholeplasma sp.]
MNSYTELRSLDKVVLIDYLTVNIDDFRVIKHGRNDYRIQDDKFDKLLTILGFNKEINNLQAYLPLHGFTNGFLLNQFTRISWGGEHVKSNGKYVVSIEMSGQALREFEKYSGHSWLDLLRMIFSFESFRISRCDFAIDDFTAKEISLPYIRDLLEQGLYTSNSRYGSHVSSWVKNSDERTTAGFTFYIGKKGGNQLAIYDKLRERLFSGHEVETEAWNRYEMRFVQEKAYSVLEQYYLALESDNGFDLKKYVQGLLLSFLDLKDEDDKNSRIRRKATNPKWLNFLDSISKIDIKSRVKEPPTYDKKMQWVKSSLPSTFAEMIITQDFDGAQRIFYEAVAEAIDNLQPSKIARLNQYLLENNKKTFNEERSEEIKSLIKSILDLND